MTVGSARITICGEANVVVFMDIFFVVSEFAFILRLYDTDIRDFLVASRSQTHNQKNTIPSLQELTDLFLVTERFLDCFISVALIVDQH